MKVIASAPEIGPETFWGAPAIELFQQAGKDEFPFGERFHAVAVLEIGQGEAVVDARLARRQFQSVRRRFPHSSPPALHSRTRRLGSAPIPREGNLRECHA